MILVVLLAVMGILPPISGLSNCFPLYLSLFNGVKTILICLLQEVLNNRYNLYIELYVLIFELFLFCF